MAKHAHARRRRATFRPGRQRAGLVLLPGDLRRPGLLLTALDQRMVLAAGRFFGVVPPAPVAEAAA